MPWEFVVAMFAITGSAAVFVAWPLLVGTTRPEEYLGSESYEPVMQQLTFKRDTLYAAMKELEFDRAMGNLSDQDFQQLQERYKRRAVAILKQIDDARAGRMPAGAPPDEDDELTEVPPTSRPESRARRAPHASVELDVEQEIEAFRRKSRQQTGGEKGVPRPASEMPGPGAAPSTCPACGRPVKDAEAAFCARCGAPLRQRGGSRPRSGQRGRKANGVKGD